MKKILFTIDTEVGEKARDAKRGFEDFVEGKIKRRQVGTALIARELEQHGFRGEFFVDIYEHKHFGGQRYKDLCVSLDERGHGVQLHTHPGFLYDKDRRNMYEYSSKEQENIIKEGKALIKQWIGKEPVAHRAGSYGADNNTLKALKRSGIPIDSSYVHGHKNCRIKNESVNEAAEIEGVVEVPVSTRHQYTMVHGVPVPIKRWLTVSVDNLPLRKLIKSIESVREGGLPVVLIMHSSTFVKRDKTGKRAIGAHEAKIREFRKLLSYLKRNGYEHGTYEELLQEPRKPNCFVVGNPKSGTTALHHFLAQHPDIYVPNPVAPYHFCTDLHRASDQYHGKKEYFTEYRDKQSYLELYRARREKALCDVSTNYLFSKEAPRMVKQFNPDAKIIIMVRDPVSFLESLHQELIYQAVEKHTDLKQALDAEEKRRKGKDLPRKIAFPAILYYDERARSSNRIKRWLDMFPQENVKIVLFDDFKRDNEKTMQEVFSFLSVDEQASITYTSRNKNKEVKYPRLNYLVGWLGKSWAAKIIPKSIKSRLGLAVRQSITYEAKRKPIDPSLAADLKDKYLDEARALSKITSRDLIKEWEYSDEGRNNAMKSFFAEVYEDKDDPWGMERASQRRRNEFYLSGIKRSLPRKKPEEALEIACGDGRLAKELAPLSKHLDVADSYEQMLRLAKKNLKGTKIRTFIHNELPKMGFNKKYDVVYAIEVIYYLTPKEQQEFYDNIHRIIKPGGLLIMTSETGEASYDKKHFKKKASYDRPLELFSFTDKAYRAKRMLKLMIDIADKQGYMQESKSGKVQMLRKRKKLLKATKPVLRAGIGICRAVYQSRVVEGAFFRLGRIASSKEKDNLVVYQRR